MGQNGIAMEDKALMKKLLTYMMGTSYWLRFAPISVDWHCLFRFYWTTI